MTRCQRSPCLVYRMQRKAYRIADNKLPLGAGWDLELLATELNDLLADEFDLSLTGFDSDEIDQMLNVDFAPGSEDDQGKLDELEEKLCPHCGVFYDNSHR